MLDAGDAGTTQPADVDRIAIGAIRRPVGLKGDVMVTAFGDTLEGLRIPGTVALVDESGRATAAILAGRRQTPQGFLCRFDGIESMDAAETLRNRTIAIEASRLPALAENRFYHFELEGMMVVGRLGEEIGTVTAVHEYPTTDAVEIRTRSGNGCIIPLSGGAVVSVDRQRRQVVVDREMLEELL